PAALVSDEPALDEDALALAPLTPTDFAPDFHNPDLRFLPDGFVLPNQQVTLWSIEPLYDLTAASEFVLEFDARLELPVQEVIVAFSNNQIPWGYEGPDALTVRFSPGDQDIWFRTGFYENWLDPRLFYNSSEGVFEAGAWQRYRFVLSASRIAISVDGREVAAASLQDAEFPPSGYVGFVVFGSDQAGESTVSYRNIAAAQVGDQTPGAVLAGGQEPGGSREIEGMTATNPAASLDGDGEYHALVIAVQDYVDDAIKDLDFPVQDAQRLVQTLTGAYSFDAENVRMLTNPKKADIMRALDQISREVKPEDNLLIFYAGHGSWDDRMEQGFWLPADAERDFRANWLSNGTLRDYLKAIKTQHTLLVTDACFSGGIFKTRALGSGASRAVESLYALPSRKAITSGTKNEEVPDKSLFIQYLVQRLEENEQPFLTGQRLFMSIQDPVSNNSPQVPQFGVVFGTGDEGGDFVFRRRDAS
ncbi:MAG: caspase family protein, partial [Rhodothermales bacterium]|nr:caspase family protein [Rhodothermales bacterium]